MPDPVLGGAELTRRRIRSAHAAQQLRVQLADETQREWQGRQSLEPLVQGPDIVDDLFDVAWRIVTNGIDLERQEVVQRTLRSFSLADAILAVMSTQTDAAVWSYDHHMDVLGVRRWLPES